MAPSVVVKGEPGAVKGEPGVKGEPVGNDAPPPYDEAYDDGSDDDNAGGDIKPVLAGLKPNAVTFNPVRPIKKAGPLKPNEFVINLHGCKDGQSFKIRLRMLLGDTVLMIKNHLVYSYGYEMNQLRIIYDGTIVQDQQTMAALKVEDNDDFDIFLEQFGG